MRKNQRQFRRFEDKLIKEEAPDFARNLRIYTALHKEAVGPGVFPLKDPLEDIETDILLARRLNCV